MLNQVLSKTGGLLAAVFLGLPLALFLMTLVFADMVQTALTQRA